MLQSLQYSGLQVPKTKTFSYCQKAQTGFSGAKWKIRHNFHICLMSPRVWLITMGGGKHSKYWNKKRTRINAF